MRSTENPSQKETNPETGSPHAVESDVYAEIVALARLGASPVQFLGRAFRIIGHHFSSPYAALHVRYASQVVQDHWHCGPTDPGFWKPSLQEFLTESLAEPKPRAKLLQAKGGTTRIAFLSSPVFDPSGPAIGAVALVIAPVEDQDLTSRLIALEAMTRLISFAAEFLGNSASREALGEGTGTAARSGLPDRALARAAACTTVEELAFALTNEACNKLGCEQVALGMAKNRAVRVISISGLDSVRSQSPGVAALRAAMEECLDAGNVIIQQSEKDYSDEAPNLEYRLHKQWHAASRGDSVASIPLKVGEHTVAVLSMRRSATQPFKAGQIDELRARIEPFASALTLLQRARRGLVRHAIDAIHDAIVLLLRPGARARKALVAAATLSTGIFFFGSMPYNLAVPCVVTPAQVRHVAAPFDATIAVARVMEGDRVAVGDLLCELDHRDLDQQRAELEAELAVLERSMDRALADHSAVEAQLALANRQLVSTRLQIVRRRIEQAALRSPLDGVVVAGDLRKRVGGVVARGETLFQVAPLSTFTLEMHVPEHASGDLAEGLAGAFTSFANPAASTRFAVHRVLSAAQVRGGKNVFVAEADIAAQADWMRPGMEGVAKINAGPKRICWIVLHRAWNYLRMNLWL